MINLGRVHGRRGGRHQGGYALPRVRRHERGVYRLSSPERHRQRAGRTRHQKDRRHGRHAGAGRRVRLRPSRSPDEAHRRVLRARRRPSSIAAEKGYTMVEDAGRGYRQVVPSPKPMRDHREERRQQADWRWRHRHHRRRRRHPRHPQGRQAVRHTRRHRQGLCLREAGTADQRGHAHHPDRSRPRRHQLRQAAAARPCRALAGRGTRLYRTGAVRPRLYAAEG